MQHITLTGRWRLNVKVGPQNGIATFDLTEGEGGTLSGTYTGQLGTAKVSGSVKSSAVNFGFNWHGGKVVYHGTHTDGKLEGTCTYGAASEGTFEGGRIEG